MKTIMKQLYILIIIFCSISVAKAQFEEQKERYWIYHERLNNFMIATDNSEGLGEVITARRREVNDMVFYSDEPWMISYRIATLAMEYDLLTRSGLSLDGPEINEVKKELYYAINTINRLDWEAEQTWDCSECVADGYCPENINGFLIRDDVPGTYATNQFYIDMLNDSWVPPVDGYRVKCINSSYVEIVNAAEASQDHLAALLFGLAFVKRLLPINATWNNTVFLDGENSTTSFVREVQLISHRILKYLVDHDWTYWNLCEDRCVYGTRNERNDNLCYNPGKEHNPSCEAGGANAGRHAIGFTAAVCYITEGSQYYSYSALQYIYARQNQSRVYAWNIALTMDKTGFVRMLAAVGNIGVIELFEDETNQELFDRLTIDAIKFKREYLPLAYNLLHQKAYSNDISEEYYQCLLDAAPCRGYDGYSTQSVEWNASDRIGGDRNNPSSDLQSRLDYMFYFNLVYESHYGNLYNYAPIPIDQLALDNIHKSGYTEYDKKNFMAANEIIADNYTIANSPAEGTGRVTFVAGENITLSNGFHVTEGSTFHGYIDGSVGAMTCTEPVVTDCSSLLDQDKMAEQMEYFRRKDSVTNAMLQQYMMNANTSEEFAPASDVYLTAAPNPSNGRFTIESNLHDAEITIMTMTGEVVYSGQYHNEKVELDLTNLNQGVYILNIRNCSATKSVKLVFN